MPKSFLFIGSYDDKPEIPNLHILLRGHKVEVTLDTPKTLGEVAFYCKNKKIDAVITTNQGLLAKLVQLPEGSPTVDDFAGSILDIKYPGISQSIECLIVNPLPQIYTVRYGQHILRRYLSKLTAPEQWKDPLTDFKWELATPEGLESFYEELDEGSFLVCDTETLRNNTKFSCVGYCLVRKDFSTRTIVIPFNSLFNLAYIRRINKHRITKCFQNGLYDNSYFLRFGAPVTNYLLDTFHLFHSWQSEMPKDLGFVTAYTLRKWPFWKDLASTQDLQVYYEYNARDCFGTANALIVLLNQMPKWATKNYTDFEFPMVFPSLYCQMEGWKIDVAEFNKLKKNAQAELWEIDKSLAVMTRTPDFNANSHVQVKKLLTLCRIAAVETTKESMLLKYKYFNPLAGRFVEKILKRREHKKAIGTYFVDEKIWNIENPKLARFLYGLNPGRTDTGRLASDSHPFWFGANIQNIPSYAKSMFCADEGYLLGEPDCKQSEARCVAYESQDENLITTVESDRDYHAINVERFFGIAYEQVITPEGKVINKPIRDVSKRVNHGSNYNMTWPVLVDTMGLEAIYKAKELLKLPKNWGPKEIGTFLLHTYDKTYPRIKSVWYEEIKYAVESTKMLVSSLGWTRYCWGNPRKNKRDLNAYVAHVPQNLSVQIINKGMYKALAFQKKHWPNFRLKAQIHDSTPFQYKEGREDVAHEYSKLLEMSVLVKGRTMLIPVDVKLGAQRWSEIK